MPFPDGLLYIPPVFSLENDSPPGSMAQSHLIKRKRRVMEAQGPFFLNGCPKLSRQLARYHLAMALLQLPRASRSVTVSVSLRSPAVTLVALKQQVTLGATLALRISRTAWLPNADHLCPFALGMALPSTLVDRDFHDYYGHSVSPRGRPPKAHPVFRHDETSRASCRCLTHHLPESSLLPTLSVRVRRHGYFILNTKRPWLQAFYQGTCTSIIGG